MRPIPLWQFLIYLLVLITLAVILAGSYHAASAAGNGSPQCRQHCPHCGERPPVPIAVNKIVVKIGAANLPEWRHPRTPVIKLGLAYQVERRRKS